MTGVGVNEVDELSDLEEDRATVKTGRAYREWSAFRIVLNRVKVALRARWSTTCVGPGMEAERKAEVATS